MAPLSQQEQTIFLALLSRLVKINNEFSRAPMRAAFRFMSREGTPLTEKTMPAARTKPSAAPTNKP